MGLEERKCGTMRCESGDSSLTRLALPWASVELKEDWLDRMKTHDVDEIGGDAMNAELLPSR